MRIPDNLFTIVTEDYPVISEADFTAAMTETVKPYLDRIRTDVMFKRKSGQKVHAVCYKLPGLTKGTVFISHGFSESTEKYHEVAYYFLKEGYGVCAIDHRGHGLSRRPDETDVANTPSHVDRYQDYIDDMHHVVTRTLMSDMQGPYYLYAHSMGGAIGATYLEQHPGIFKKAVFNAPMFEINRGGASQLQSDIAAYSGCLFGSSRKYFLGQQGFSKTPNFEASASTCLPRFQYYFDQQIADPNLQNAGCSYGWIKASFQMDRDLLKPRNIAKIDIPVLLFQAEKDDFVYPGGQNTFMSLVKDGTFYLVPGSKHEIYMGGDDILPKYWSAIFRFLEG